MPDKKEIDNLIDQKLKAPNTISVGVTWVDGRILFKHNKKQSQVWYGICHYSKMVFALTPLDYVGPIMITTISVAPPENYCERAYSCLYFDCPLNRFDKRIFIKMFHDCGGSSLGMPLDVGTKPLWFNHPSYSKKWEGLMIPIVGGRLEYNEEEGRKLGIG